MTRSRTKKLSREPHLRSDSSTCSNPVPQKQQQQQHDSQKLNDQALSQTTHAFTLEVGRPQRPCKDQHAIPDHERSDQGFSEESICRQLGSATANGAASHMYNPAPEYGDVQSSMWTEEEEEESAMAWRRYRPYDTAILRPVKYAESSLFPSTTYGRIEEDAFLSSSRFSGFFEESGIGAGRLGFGALSRGCVSGRQREEEEGEAEWDVNAYFAPLGASATIWVVGALGRDEWACDFCGLECFCWGVGVVREDEAVSVRQDSMDGGGMYREEI
jgi:hypothetical protein